MIGEVKTCRPHSIMVPAMLKQGLPQLLAAAIVVSAAIGLTRGGTQAQQVYPAHTVRLILPFGAASATDITARLFADRLSARWGKPVVVENRPGGDGLVALNALSAHATITCCSSVRRRSFSSTSMMRRSPAMICAISHRSRRST